MTVELTARQPTVGRILHLYHPLLGHDPQPCIVTGGPFNEPNNNTKGGDSIWGPHANVNVFVDGANYPEFLQELRASSSGNTFTSVPVFDPLKPEQRDALRQRRSTPGLGIWCEWPQ